MRNMLAAAGLAALVFAASQAFAANPRVGGPMFENRNIVENAVNSEDHTTLVAAVKAAGLVDTLAGPGPFTVFAPVNEALEALLEGTVETLLMPENRDDLTGVLTYHVAPGKITAQDLADRSAENDCVYIFIFETVNGAKISPQMRGDTIYIGDKSGNNATISDVNQSSGVIHVIDRVLLPM